jgi:hypothetical protein
MKCYYLIFLGLALIILLLNCKGNVSPLDSTYSKIIPLELNNIWTYKNQSNGNTLEIKVIDKWNDNGQTMYKLNSGTFTQSITNLYYIDDDLYGQLNDTTYIMVFKKDGPKFHSGVTYPDFENITVPAGSFFAIRVETFGYSGHSYFGSTTWYSFGVGPIKRKRFFINWNGRKTETIHVLESYSLKTIFSN